MKRILPRLKSIWKNASRTQIIIGIVIVCGVLYYFNFFRGSSLSEGVVVAARGTIIQEVNVTGNTKPLETVNLAFEQAGKVAGANVRVGDHVIAGQVLAYLDQSQLLAERSEQEANVDSEQAKLQEMQKGSRPEDVQIKQAALAEANQDLETEYQSAPDTLNDAYIQAEDAIRKQLDSLFVNDEQSSVQLTFQVNSAQLKSNAENNRFNASIQLNDWKKELSGLSTNSDKLVLEQVLAHATQKLSFFRDFLTDLMAAVTGSNGLSSSDLDTYKANVTTARTKVNTALTTVNSLIQSISSKKLAVKQSQADLNRTLAGNTPESIASQSAEVKQAQARVQATNAQIQKAILRAPFTGVITKQDAKTGEIASPNTPVISVISDGKLEIEAKVPEVDIGKITVENPVEITIDAFPGEIFLGKVRYIDPAETVIDGVTNFKITIDFEKPDPRLKSGLTANITIQTLKKEGVVTLPLYAIVQNTSGTFVMKKEGTVMVQTPITVGLRGYDGTVEVLSGVSEGETVFSSNTAATK